MPTFATPGPITATVQVAGAQVRVTASDRTDTVVLVEPLDGARRSGKVAAKTKVDFAGGQLSVKTTVAGDKNGSVAITIALPAGSNLVAYLAHSSVQVDGPLGESELHTASGRVQLDRTDALHANISAGEVAVGHVAGRAEIDGSAIDVRIGEVDGTVRIAGARGQAWIGHASADLDLSSAGGGFDIGRADAGVTATTASGAIRIGRLSRGHARLVTGSGDIEVGIGEGAAAAIDADSERGAVRNSVAAQAIPAMSDVMVSVHARTRDGDIIIRRVAADPQEASVISTS